jgi:hypothetical protein
MSFKLSRALAKQVEQLSCVLNPMAQSIVRGPLDRASFETFTAAILLSGLAWDRAVGADPAMVRGGYYGAVAGLVALEKMNPRLWDNFVSEDPFRLLRELQQFKLEHFPDDCRTTFEHVAPKHRSRWLRR